MTLLGTRGFWVKGLTAFERAALVKRVFPAICSCGRRYGFDAWQRLVYVGTQKFSWGEVQSLRNCKCGSTMAIVIEQGEAEDA